MSSEPTEFPDPQVQVMRIQLEIAEGTLVGDLELPHGPMGLAELAYRVLDLSSAVAGMAERSAAKLGHTVSCRKGCAACCRLLVSVSLPEALMIAGIVDAMPEPRRHQIKERFDKVEIRLKETGMHDRLKALQDSGASRDDHQAVAADYFALQIPCPFLEDESCGIYEHRPSMCREYQVTSPAEFCQDPSGKEVRRLPVSVRLSEALARLAGGLLRHKPCLFPLALAPAWTRPWREKVSSMGWDGRKLIAMLLESLRGRDHKAKPD